MWHRLKLAGYTDSLREMREHWSIDDLLDAHEAVDYREEMEAIAWRRTGNS